MLFDVGDVKVGACVVVSAERVIVRVSLATLGRFPGAPYSTT